MVEIVALFLTLGALLYRLHVAVYIVAVISFLVALFFSILFRSKRGVLFSLIAGSVLLLGALMMHVSETSAATAMFGNRTFEGRVVSVDRRLDRTLITVRDERFGQKIQLSVRGRSDSLPGDLLAIQGTVAPPDDFLTDSGRVFGYREYLASKGIGGILFDPTISTRRVGSFSPMRIATTLRYDIADIFSRYISFPFDGVLAGMTVGYQGGLPTHIQDTFRNTGVLHVLVLSGYNITLLAGFILVLLKNVPYRIRSLTVITAIVIVVLISGAGVASVRAGIMGAIAVVAGLSLKSYRPIRALLIAYLCFFCISPKTIFVDPGFHLSFLATLFMVAVLPKIEPLFSFIPKTRYVDVRELVLLAGTIPLFMLPYMMFFSGSVPLISPLANTLFALVTPVIMVTGVVLIAVSWIHPLAVMVSTTVSFGGHALLSVLELFSRLPLWNTPPLSGALVAMIYAGCIGIVFRQEITQYLRHLYTRLHQQSS